MLGVIKEELAEIAERFGDERRTEISHSEDEIDIEDLIADQQMVITITQSGYIKSLPLATYRQQQRGGRGVTGMDMKDGDFIEHLFVTSSHDYLLFFSNRGKVYRSKVYELPEAQRTAKGRALVNILPLREGERIQAVVSTRDFSETQYLVFATRNGTVKKTELAAYNTPIKADGIIAINIRDDDELLAVRAVDPDDEVIMVSQGRPHRPLRRVRRRARWAATPPASAAWTSARTGSVIAMDVARDDMDLLVVTENGYGKRTQISQYRKTNRGAKGVKTIGLTEQKGALAGALVVREHQELVFISVGGMVQRTARRRHLPAGPLGHRRARHEPQGRRRRQRRRAGRRHRRGQPRPEDRARSRRTPPRTAENAASPSSCPPPEHAAGAARARPPAQISAGGLKIARPTSEEGEVQRRPARPSSPWSSRRPPPPSRRRGRAGHARTAPIPTPRPGARSPWPPSRYATAAGPAPHRSSSARRDLRASKKPAPIGRPPAAATAQDLAARPAPASARRRPSDRAKAARR